MMLQFQVAIHSATEDKYVEVVGFLLRDIIINLHFDSLNVMKFEEAQLLMASTSCCNEVKSLLEEIGR